MAQSLSHAAIGAPLGERYLDVGELARELRLGVSTLNKMRMRGDGPPYVKFGRRVRYPARAAAEWASGRLVRSTSDPKNYGF